MFGRFFLPQRHRGAEVIKAVRIHYHDVVMMDSYNFKNSLYLCASVVKKLPKTIYSPTPSNL